MFVIYHKETTLLVDRKTYKTEAAAKAALTRYLNKRAAEGEDDVLSTDFGIANKIDFHAMIEKQVTRTNLMSGKPFVEPINTPVYCSPACNAYWEM